MPVNQPIENPDHYLVTLVNDLETVHTILWRVAEQLASTARIERSAGAMRDACDAFTVLCLAGDLLCRFDAELEPNLVECLERNLADYLAEQEGGVQ